MEPMTPEQWAEASTRGALIAQLRGQQEAGKIIMAELRRHRELLQPIWHQTHAETFRPEIPDEHWYKVWFTAGELRAIAALFVEDDDDPDYTEVT